MRLWREGWNGAKSAPLPWGYGKNRGCGMMRRRGCLVHGERTIPLGTVPKHGLKAGLGSNGVHLIVREVWMHEKRNQDYGK